MSKLSPKQARFVEEYLCDLNATQAAIRAGYSQRTAYSAGQRLLKHVEISAAIASAKADRAVRTEVTQEYVVENLAEIIERCMQRAPVMARPGEQVVDYEGRHVWTFNAKDAVAALRVLAKHTGGFVDKVEVTGEAGGPIEITVTRHVVPATNRIAAHVGNGKSGNGKRANGRAGH